MLAWQTASQYPVVPKEYNQIDIGGSGKIPGQVRAIPKALCHGFVTVDGQGNPIAVNPGPVLPGTAVGGFPRAATPTIIQPPTSTSK